MIYYCTQNQKPVPPISQRAQIHPAGAEPQRAFHVKRRHGAMQRHPSATGQCAIIATRDRRDKEHEGTKRQGAPQRTYLHPAQRKDVQHGRNAGALRRLAHSRTAGPVGRSFAGCLDEAAKQSGV